MCASEKQQRGGKRQRIDPAVDALIEKAQPFAQPILVYLRALVHQVVPDVEEQIKWSRPFFLVDGTIICHMQAFKHHLGFGFWSPEMTALLQTEGTHGPEAAGSFGRITTMDDLPAKPVLLRYIRTAADAARIGSASSPVASRPRVSAKPAIDMPAEFAAALLQSKSASATFEGFPPSCRREYLEWITSAKRAETRARRIVQAVEMLASGKRYNEQYR